MCAYVSTLFFIAGAIYKYSKKRHHLKSFYMGYSTIKSTQFIIAIDGKSLFTPLVVTKKYSFNFLWYTK